MWELKFIERFELEGTFKIISIPSAMGRDAMILDKQFKLVINGVFIFRTVFITMLNNLSVPYAEFRQCQGDAGAEPEEQSPEGPRMLLTLPCST